MAGVTCISQLWRPRHRVICDSADSDKMRTWEPSKLVVARVVAEAIQLKKARHRNAAAFDATKLGLTEVPGSGRLAASATGRDQ